MMNQLAGRTLWVPRMSHVGARFLCAGLRSAGIDARVTPDSNDRTLELGNLHTSGEECYPQKIVLGGFLQVLEENGPDATAFMLPTANGPCRFGQYAPYLKQLLRNMGHADVPVVAPSSKNGYEELGGTQKPIEMIRSLWRGIVCGDLLRKMLLKTRPYETLAGASDLAYLRAQDIVEEVLASPLVSMRKRMSELVDAMREARAMFRAVPAKYVKGRPLIGVVGEIFCRLNTFSNSDALRNIERHGGECWISDIGEWVLYTNWGQKNVLKRDGKGFSLSMLGAILKDKVQKSDVHKLESVFTDDFVGYEEPHDLYEQVLKPAWPYLPADGSLGEMVLSVGRSLYLQTRGADGIVDISPFACMNGIITEAVYHDVIKDAGRFPIRNFYFDATCTTMDRDLDIFMELVQGYRAKKSFARTYPAFFE